MNYALNVNQLHANFDTNERHETTKTEIVYRNSIECLTITKRFYFLVWPTSAIYNTYICTVNVLSILL